MSPVAIKGILRADFLRLARDQFLLGMTAYILGIALLLRFAVPWIDGELQARMGFELGPWYPLISSHFVVGLAGLLAGILGGLLLMEGRETGTLRAQLVSPVPVTAYVRLMGAVMFVGSIVLALVSGALLGFNLPPWPALLLTSVMAAPASVAIGLFIAAMSATKTEAFVYLKICAILPLVPSGAYFLPEPWQWLAGIHPSYFAAKAYWLAEAGEAGWALWACGAVVPAAFWLWLMARMFVKAAR